MRARSRIRKDASVVSKGMPSGIAEGGIHVHTLVREFGRTKPDGAHFHVFLLPSGEVVQSEEDGRHIHDFGDHGEGKAPAEGTYGLSGGSHTHQVNVNGTIIVSSDDGQHHHQMQTDSSAFDGVHSHTMVLLDGTPVRSLLPHEIHFLEGRPAQAALPEAPPASVLAKSDSSCLVSLTKFGFLHILLGDTLVSAEVGRHHHFTKEDAEDFTIHGSSKFFALHGRPAQIGGGPLVKRSDDEFFIGEGTFDDGLRTENTREYFLHLPQLMGTLTLFKDGDAWACSLLTNTVPEVLEAGFPMPPPGVSALPKSLEPDVPPTVRYWETEDPSVAKAQRDWLVETEFFTHDAEIRRVDGELRKVVIARSFFAHEPAPLITDAWTREISRMIPGGVQVVSPFAEEDWQSVLRKSVGDGVLLLVDPPSSVGLSPQSLTDMVKGAPFLIAHPDTPLAREVFAKVGRPFKLRDVSAHDRLFVASFPIVSKSVVWVKIPSKETALSKSTISQKSEDASAARVYDRLNRLQILRAETNEERFVYGVAMEPDEVDTQGDTQTVETIRAAAHKYMEDYGNIGLQHKTFITGKVKILESALLPGDVEVAGQILKAGTWIFGVRVIDDEIWKAVKDGSLTGFSIGGTAVRAPV